MDFDVSLLAKRYRLATFGEAGGVLLDGDTGALQQLNPTACRLVTALLTGEAFDAVAAELAAQTGAEASRIAADARALAATLSAEPPPHERPSRVHPAAHVALETDPATQRVTLLVHGTPRLRWWPAAQTVARAQGDSNAQASAPGCDLTYALRLLLPHMATHYGHYLLHGSALAVTQTGTAVVWLGASGAGKSTLATEAAAAEVGTALADDLVPLYVSTHAVDVPRIARNGEATLRTWCADVAAVLRDAAVEEAQPLVPLPAVSRAETLEVRNVALVAASQRHAGGARIERKTLRGPAAFTEVLRHTFAELGTPSARHTAFATASHVARTVPVEKWQVPDSQAALRSALEAAWQFNDA